MTFHREQQQPWVTVDVVLLAPVAAGQDGWRVLLIERGRPPFQGQWALPGGFVEPFEPLEQAARRELFEETGLEPERLEQLYTFGAPGRDPRGWTISVAYLAVVGREEAEGFRPQAADDAANVAWFDLHALPALAFDHADMLDHARHRLGLTA